MSTAVSPGPSPKTSESEHLKGVAPLRAGQGQELATSEDAARLLVRAEFERMTLAEREAGSAITMQSLAELAAKQIGGAPRPAIAASNT